MFIWFGYAASQHFGVVTGRSYSLQIRPASLPKFVNTIMARFGPCPAGMCRVPSYGSPIFKAVQQKRCTALYTALTKSLKSPEYAVGEGSEWSNVDWSVAVPH